MTIQELYNWAVENNVEDCDIIVKDSYGSDTYCVDPEIKGCGYFNAEGDMEICNEVYL